MNILIGAVKHCNVERLEVWAKSAYECFPEVKKILLCMDDEIPSNIKKLESLNFEIVHTPSPAQKNIDVMKYERHHAIAKYISNYAPDDIILTTDTFDVFFQSNPFEWYESNRTNDLLIGSEGITVENEHWNRGVISKSFPLNIKDVLKNDVFCAGIIMGKVHVLSDLMSSIYNFTKHIKNEDSEGVDQGALNVLLTNNYFKSKLQKTTTTENFVVHCAVAGPTELFIPWGFKNNYKYDLPIFDGNCVVNKDGKPYCIVHQYNRVKEWDKFFNEKYRKIQWVKVEQKIEITTKVKPEEICNDTAIVVCSRVNSSYSADWNNVLKFTNNDYLLCDVGNGNIPNSNSFNKFVADNIINYTEAHMREILNFKENPSKNHWWNLNGGRNIIWFYPHLRMLYFYLTNPNYKYYWFFDEDVTFPQQSVYEFVSAHLHLPHDCMITYLFSSEGSEDVLDMSTGMGSFHAKDCNWLSRYPGAGDAQNPNITKTHGSYFPLVRLSNKAMQALLEEHNSGYYGYSEGYVPTTLGHKGLSLYSIYDKNSEIKSDKKLIVYHRRYLELLWKNV